MKRSRRMWLLLAPGPVVIIAGAIIMILVAAFELPDPTGWRGLPQWQRDGLILIAVYASWALPRRRS